MKTKKQLLMTPDAIRKREYWKNNPEKYEEHKAKAKIRSAEKREEVRLQLEELARLKGESE